MKIQSCYRPIFTGIALTLLCSLATAQPQPAEASIRVDASKRLNAISPLLYGHFAEFMFEDIKGGLWAELLQNRGFEMTAPPPSLSQSWDRYPDNRNDDYVFFTGGGELGVAEAGYPPEFPNRAQVLVTTRDDLQEHGMYQDRIPLRKGLTYRGSLWLRGAELAPDNRTPIDGTFRGRIRVTLEENITGGKVYAHRDFSSIETEWKRFEFEFPVEVEDPQARFTVQINGRGIVWVDQVSLMPGNAADNLRSDVVEKIRELRPAFIRWPGGNVAQDYHWIWGVGPRDRRPAWVNMSWDEDPEPSDFGTLEYLAFCQAIGAEPNLVVNVEGRGVTVAEAAALRADGRDIYSESRPATDQEAAGWVEYVNGPATSKYGALRAKHGHPKPFGVKYWEIGNEIWGDWVRGYSDAATYAVNARRYIRAMKAVDPSIKIIAVGHNDMEWNRTVLREIGDEIDMISIHHYYGQDDSPAGRANLMSKPLWFEKFYGRVGDLIQELQPDRKITLAINEWATTLPLPRQNTMQAALYGARLMNAFERKGDLVEMSAISDLINGWPGGLIQASRRRLFTTPNYAVISAYNAHRGDWRLEAEMEVNVLHQPTDPELGEDIPALDVVASISEDGREIQLKVVNTSMDTDIPTEIKIEGLRGSIASEAQIVTIRGATLEAANSFRAPDAITARQRTVASTGDRFSFLFEKHSVNVIVLQVGNR